MSREWFRFFNNLYVLTGGGTTDTSLADLQLAPVYQLTPPDATAADLAPQTVTVVEPQFDLSPRFELGTLASQNADNITFGNLTVTGTATFSAGTANQVQYLNASKVLTGSVNLTFDGTTLTAAGFAGPHNGTVGAGTPNTGAFTTLSASSTVSGTGFSTYLASPPAIGSTAASTGAFTTLSASSTVSGTGFSTYLASPPAIGSTAASTGAFTTLSASSTFTLSGGTANGVGYLNGSKVFTSGAALTFDGTNFATTGSATASALIPSGSGVPTNGFYLPSANTVGIATASTQRVSISSTGAITVIAPSSGTALTLNSSGGSVNLRLTRDANNILDFYHGGGTQYIDASAAGSTLAFSIAGISRATLDSSGNLTVPAMYGTTVTTPRNVFIDSAGKMGGISSTRASKANIAPLTDVSWLYDLKPVSFNYRKRDEDGVYLAEFEREKQYGMIAEDTVPIAPDLCVFDDKGKVVGIHYDRMVAPLLKALQDQAARIDALEKKLGYHSR